MTSQTTNSYEVISIIPVELFSNENLKMLLKNLEELEEKGRVAKGPEGLANSFKQFSNYEYDLFSLESHMLSDCLGDIEKYTEIKFAPEKSKILLALQQDGTSLCLVRIFHFEGQSSSATEAIAGHLKEIRNKVKQEWEDYLGKPPEDDNNNQKTDSTEACSNRLAKYISSISGETLEDIPVFTSIECFDYHFTFFGLSEARTENKTPIEDLFENESNQETIESSQSTFMCDWSTLVLWATNQNYLEEIDRVMAMEILAQSLWNKYDKFSKLADRLSKEGTGFLKLDRKILVLNRRNIDFQLYTMPEDIHSVMSSSISRQSIQMLEAISETSRLEFTIKKMVASRNALQHLEYVDFEVAELKSQATIQWLLIFLGLFGVANAIFTFEWINLEDISLTISLISIAIVISVLSMLILLQRYKIRKNVRLNFKAN